MAIMKYISTFLRYLWIVLCPTWYARYYYKRVYKKRLDLKNPIDYLEKVQWLKVYSDLRQWTKLADKYQVREYVESCGLGHILVNLYGVWKDATDINFELLPDKFVLKTNNGCGTNLLVYDKEKLNNESTVKLLNKWVKERQGLTSFQPHLWNIERRILAEELLEDLSTKAISNSIIDYKFFCFHGEPYFIDVLYDRDNKSIGAEQKTGGCKIRENVYDLDWNIIPNILTKHSPYDNLPIIPKPACLDEMISISRRLSESFPQVRIDLYLVNGKIYFGEMTFTSGKMDEFSKEYLKKMGDKIDLSLAKRRSKLFII